MKRLAVIVLVFSIFAAPALASAQYTSSGWWSRPHSWDDPKNRPIDAKGVNTRSSSTGNTQTQTGKPDYSHRTPPATMPPNLNLHGSYGIAK